MSPRPYLALWLFVETEDWKNVLSAMNRTGCYNILVVKVWQVILTTSYIGITSQNSVKLSRLTHCLEQTTWTFCLPCEPEGLHKDRKLSPRDDSSSEQRSEYKITLKGDELFLWHQSRAEWGNHFSGLSTVKDLKFNFHLRLTGHVLSYPLLPKRLVQNTKLIVQPWKTCLKTTEIYVAPSINQIGRIFTQLILTFWGRTATWF